MYRDWPSWTVVMGTRARQEQWPQGRWRVVQWGVMSGRRIDQTWFLGAVPGEALAVEEEWWIPLGLQEGETTRISQTIKLWSHNLDQNEFKILPAMLINVQKTLQNHQYILIRYHYDIIMYIITYYNTNLIECFVLWSVRQITKSCNILVSDYTCGALIAKTCPGLNWIMKPVLVWAQCTFLLCHEGIASQLLPETHHSLSWNKALPEREKQWLSPHALCKYTIHIQTCTLLYLPEQVAYMWHRCLPAEACLPVQTVCVPYMCVYQAGGLHVMDGHLKQKYYTPPRRHTKRERCTLFTISFYFDIMFFSDAMLVGIRYNPQQSN